MLWTKFSTLRRPFETSRLLCGRTWTRVYFEPAPISISLPAIKPCRRDCARLTAATVCLLPCRGLRQRHVYQPQLAACYTHPSIFVSRFHLLALPSTTRAVALSARRSPTTPSCRGIPGGLCLRGRFLTHRPPRLQRHTTTHLRRYQPAMTLGSSWPARTSASTADSPQRRAIRRPVSDIRAYSVTPDLRTLIVAVSYLLLPARMYYMLVLCCTDGHANHDTLYCAIPSPSDRPLHHPHGWFVSCQPFLSS